MMPSTDTPMTMLEWGKQRREFMSIEQVVLFPDYTLIEQLRFALKV